MASSRSNASVTQRTCATGNSRARAVSKTATEIAEIIERAIETWRGWRMALSRIQAHAAVSAPRDGSSADRRFI